MLLLLLIYELLWLSMVKISMLGDAGEPEDCDSTQGGYDSPPLLDHTSGTDCSSCLLLEEVDLHGNRLTNLPSWLFIRFPFLRRVDASQNHLEDLPFTAWACTSLVELNLSSNCLSSLSCGQMESVQLQLDGDVDQRPGTPASCTSDASLPSDFMTVLSITDSEHRGINVRHLERWRDRINVRPVSYLGGTSTRSSQVDSRRSCLKELDLSHNDFEEVPSILPCVAPSLERLNLAHNRLTRFGAVDCYPASLRLLDLSHNKIAVMDLVEDSQSATSCTSTPVSIPTLSMCSYTSRLCYSPFVLKRSVVIIIIIIIIIIWLITH